MSNYDVTKIQELFKKHGITQFNVVNVCENDNGILIHVEPKETFAKYCRTKFPKRFKFKNDNELYEVEKFYINLGGTIKIVFILKKYGVILNVYSLYECEHLENFKTKYLDMTIDEIIEEDF